MLSTDEQRPVPLPATQTAAVKPLPPGAARWSLRTEVLVDGSHRMVPVAVDAAGNEVAEPKPARVSLLGSLPWASIRHRMRHTVRPLLVAGGVAGVAALVDSYDVPAGQVLAGAVAGAVAAAAVVYRVAPRYLIRGRLAVDARAEIVEREGRSRRPRLSDLAGRAAELIRRRRRLAAYIAATAGGWVAWADVVGLNPAVDGRPAVLSWGLFAALSTVCGWPYVAHSRPRPEAPAPPPDVDEPNFGQLIAARWGETVGAVARQARTIPAKTQGEEPVEIPAKAAGKLPGTVLRDVHRVVGGWAATIVDPLNRGLVWVGDVQNGQTVTPRRQIAAVFGVGLAAVTLEPDPDNASECHVMVQKHSPLRDVVRWDGPGSVDAKRGTGMAGRYADGATMFYEVYRPGWGCPHDALFGTTGSGKSETFQTLMVIDRWMYHGDEAGRSHGLVADFLIDPQHGQSFGPFLNDLAAPVAAAIEEATLMVEAFTREGLRRNAYLADVEWFDGVGAGNDGRGRRRRGRKWWNPLVDGPMLVLNIDEAHYFLAFKHFTALITAAARMWRKCGMKVRIGTHTPLLGDLGGSMALRDMLTGGFVWIGRTANNLTGPTAFNGQLPVDPRSIPKVPGMAYTLAGENPRAMLMRSAWEPDFYDWVRDADDAPIGYPATLPQVTLDAFGPDFRRWRDTGVWTPPAAVSAREEPATDARAEDAVLAVLLAADGPLDADKLEKALTPYRQQGVRVSLRTARAVLGKFKADGVILPTHGRYELAPEARQRMLAERAAAGASR